MSTEHQEAYSESDNEAKSKKIFLSGYRELACRGDL